MLTWQQSQNGRAVTGKGLRTWEVNHAHNNGHGLGFGRDAHQNVLNLTRIAVSWFFSEEGVCLVAKEACDVSHPPCRTFVDA